jgi:hypothetical protein
VNVGGAGKASVTLKAIYEVGEKDDILIQEIATMFLDANNTNAETPFTITKTSEIMRSIKSHSILATLGIGEHTARMSYKLSTFNFKVDMKNPNLFHSIPSGPSGPVPVTLLDISDVHKFKIISNPVPAPLPLLGVGAAFGYSRKMRKRIKGRTLPDVATAND